MPAPPHRQFAPQKSDKTSDGSLPMPPDLAPEQAVPEVKPGRSFAAGFVASTRMEQPDGRNHAGQLGLPAEAALAEHAAQLRLDRIGRQAKRPGGFWDAEARGDRKRDPGFGRRQAVGVP